MQPDDARQVNQRGWDRLVAAENVWTRPVSSAETERARSGDWSVVLTPNKPVPRDWFGDIAGRDILCLASGGGQQGPILAAAGAKVTVFDASAAQLAQDEVVAGRDGLAIATVQGFMHDLSPFADASFDLIFHPVSNCFAPEVEPVWREAFRVLRSGGALLAAFMNPMIYIFDSDAEEAGALIVKHRLPYADVEALAPDALERSIERQHTVEYSHSFTAQIGGQLSAGFVLTHFYEDTDRNPDSIRSHHFPTCFATRAVKP